MTLETYGFLSLFPNYLFFKYCYCQQTKTKSRGHLLRLESYYIQMIQTTDPIDTIVHLQSFPQSKIMFHYLFETFLHMEPLLKAKILMMFNV